MEMNNPYLFVRSIQHMKNFDEMALFIEEEKKRHIRKINRTKRLLQTIGLVAVSSSVYIVEQHHLVLGSFLFSILFLTTPLARIVQNNTKQSQYDIILREIKREEKKRNQK